MVRQVLSDVLAYRTKSCSVTVFKHYDTSQLRAREPYYHIINYGVPFCIALAYCFIETAENGKVYGNAIIWCWITAEWDYLRIATCYGPAWCVGV